MNKIVEHALADPNNITIYKSDNTYYSEASDIESYMNASNIRDLNEAISSICSINDIDSVNIVGIFTEDYIVEQIVYEDAAEKDAMTLNDASRFYKRMLKICKDNAETIAQIDDCILILKRCIKKMEKAKADAENNIINKDRMVYAFKAIVPFQDFYKLFAKNKWETKMDQSYFDPNFKNIKVIVKAVKKSTRDVKELKKLEKSVKKIAKSDDVKKATVNTIKNMNPIKVGKSSFDIVCRLIDYTNMLKKSIASTKDSIEYLEWKKSQLKDKSTTTNEQSKWNDNILSSGEKVIFESIKDPASIKLFKDNNEYYCNIESVEDYMFMNSIGLTEAMYNIASANNIEVENIHCIIF